MAFAKKRPDTFDLELNGCKVTTDDEVKFLGLRLDKNLNFSHHVKHLRLACYERLNIIRVINSSRWHLTEKTKLEIYHSLVRSIMEYASFIFDLMPPNNKASIEVIHNTALRVIFKKEKLVNNKLISNQRFLNLANEKNMETRLRELKIKYLNKAISNNNPLIKPLHEEFLNFKGGRRLSIKTVFCDYDFLPENDRHALLGPQRRSPSPEVAGKTGLENSFDE